MADAEREDSYYHPGGVPITPQARRFGYEFPVYVSDVVWSKVCIAINIPSRKGANLEQRIWHLLQYCYDGMAKKLATTDDFLYYEFKAHFWSRDRPAAKKKQKWKLGARLLLDPSTDGPWLYIFAPNVDSIDTLEKGDPPDEKVESDSSDFADFESDGAGGHVHDIVDTPD